MIAQQAIELARKRGVEIGLNATGDGLLLETDGDPPPDLVDLLRAAKPQLAEQLRERRSILEAITAARPPDVRDDQWKVAIAGLKAFLAGGWGEKAEAAGWPPRELYAVPKLWSQISLTGNALLIGTAEVVEITPARIGIKTAQGALQGFYRRPAIDYRLIYSTQLKQRRCENASGDEEGRLRAREATIRFYCAHNNASLADSTRAIDSLIAAKGKQP